MIPPVPITACAINHAGNPAVVSCLEALLGARPSLAGVILVDNGSPAEGLAAIRGRFPGIEVLALGSNRGPGTARNAGLRAARTRHVLFVDGDVRISADLPQQLAAALHEHPPAALAMPRVLHAHDPQRIQFDGAHGHYLGLMALHHAEQPLEGASKEVRRIGSLVSACFLVDRQRWGAAPLFDESLFFYYEDHELGMRGRILGHDILSVPEAVCWHGAGTAGLALRSTGTYHPIRLFGTIRNRWAIVLTHHELRTLVLLAPMLALYEGVQLAAVVRKGWRGSWLRASASIVAGAPALLGRRRALQRARRRSDAEVLQGGALPFTPHLAQGKLEHWALARLQEASDVYWSLVRRWL